MSLETDCEQAFVELLCADPMLKAMKPLTRDQDDARTLPQIKVSAVAGDQVYEGCQPYEVAVKVEVRANQKDTAAANLDRIWSAIEKAISAARGLSRETALRFSFFMLSLEEKSDRASEEDSRLRSREYNILALGI